MVLVWVLLCSCTYLAEAAVDLKKCGDCTGRSDVPCQIKDIPYPCPHAEFRDEWPGPPRSLQVQQVYSKDQTWPKQANFTWKPPYDASISSLTGFFLTINSVSTEYGVPQLKCFFANLTGTDWSTVTDPHSVVFHFDCIHVHMPTTVHMLLNSSPMPAVKPDGKNLSIVLALGASTPVPPSSLRIKFKTSGAQVTVEFGPIVEDTSYAVCLSTLKSHYTSCEEKINTTQSPVIFSHVKRDNYTIMIQPSNEKKFYATKYFLVEGEPSTPENVIIDISIVIIILAGLIFVTVVTSVAFCVMRKKGRCGPACLKHCTDCRGQSIYERTQTNVPNNEGGEVCALCLDNESVQFLEAVSSLMSFLKTHGQCQIKGYSWPHLCLDDKDVPSMVDTYTNKVLVIFHSDRMAEFVKTNIGKEDLEVEGLSPHQKFILALLKNPKVKSQAHVSFYNHDLAHLKDIKVLNMTKLVEGKLEPCVGINTEDVQQLLKQMGSANLELTDSWSKSSELEQVLIKTKAYLTVANSSERKVSNQSDVHISDEGYDSHLTLESRPYHQSPVHHGTHHVTHHATHQDTHHTTYREIPHMEQQEMEDMSRQVRYHETKQWANTQNQLRNDYASRCYPTRPPGNPMPQVGYHALTGVTISDQQPYYRQPQPQPQPQPQHRGCYGNNNNIPKSMTREVSYRKPMEEKKKEFPTLEEGPQDGESAFEWEPPTDDDTASISFSTICERQQEVNDHYMQTLMTSGRV